MTAAVDILVRIPQGIPTKVLSTGTNESASLVISMFGQQTTTKMDAKIVGSAVTVSTAYTTASNFTKTAHPGGTVDTTTPYVYIEDTVSGTTYRYIVYNSRTARFRNSSELFDNATTSFGIEATLRDADINRSLILESYTSGTSTITTYAIQPNITTSLSGLTPTNTGWSGSYYGGGAYSGGTNGLNISIIYYGYITWSLTYSGSKYSVSSEGAGPYSIMGGYGMSEAKLIGYGNYIFVCAAPVLYAGSYYNYVCIASAPISGFTTSASVNPGWVMKNTYNPGSYTIFNGSSVGAPGLICEIQGVAFFAMQKYNTTRQYTVLFRAVLNGTTGDVNSFGLVGDINTTFDLNFCPIRVGTKLLYKRSDGSFTYVNLDGTLSAVSQLSLPYNMKTLSTNYANTYMYKNVDGASDTTGLAYYASSSAYTTNGTAFCTATGKYTLTSDSSLNQLVLFDTDNTWFEKQIQLNISDRVDYTQVTLAPSQALWVTANNDIQVNVFGFKG